MITGMLRRRGSLVLDRFQMQVPLVAAVGIEQNHWYKGGDQADNEKDNVEENVLPAALVPDHHVADAIPQKVQGEQQDHLATINGGGWTTRPQLGPTVLAEVISLRLLVTVRTFYGPFTSTGRAGGGSILRGGGRVGT